jgi:hypothetical protein
MTKHRLISTVFIATAAVLVGAAIASGAAGVKTINFTAKYAGNATVKQTGDTVDISAKGKGAGLPIGKGTITGIGTGEAKSQACNAWSGTGVLKGTKGTIKFKMLPGTQACGDEDATFFSIVGYAQVIKATGTLAKAKGKLKVTGSYDRGAGTFSAKFAGKLKK